MIMKTESFHQALNNIFKAILNSFIKAMVTDPLNNYVAGLAKQFQTTQMYKEMQMMFEKAWSALKIALGLETAAAEGVNAAASVAPVVTADVAKATSNTAVAATEAAAGAASVGGPYAAVLGIAAAAAEFAGLTPYIGLAAASGGYDIPSGVNPLTQLHQQEMVLPAKFANVIRDLAGGGSRGNSNTTYQINAMDTRSFMSRNGSQIVKGLKGHLRNMNKRF
jgi:hypothetical protein